VKRPDSATPRTRSRRFFPVVGLCAALATSAGLGCNPNAPDANVPGEQLPKLEPTMVRDTAFAGSIHRLLREGGQTPERWALLAGAVRRQLAHAAAHFERGDDARGTEAVIGAFYLIRVGEARSDMFDRDSIKALDGAIRRFSARGDEGRARALMMMQSKLLPRGSSERTELDQHVRALNTWMKDTRTGGAMQRLAGDERAAIGRALIESSEEALLEAAKAIDSWIARAVEYNLRYQEKRQLPPREEVIEAYRALQTGGQTMAAIFLRHGMAREAKEAIERSNAGRVTDPSFFQRLRVTAVDDTAEDWRLLARALARSARVPSDASTSIDPYLLEAAMWGISLEAYRRDPTSLAMGHMLAGQLIQYGMPEAAPLVLRDALGNAPTPVSLSSAMAVIADALADQYETGTTDTALRIFAASKQVLELADTKKYRGKLRPSAANVRQLMASVVLRSGQIDAARPLLLRALQDEPTVWGYTMLGTLERQAGNSEAALHHTMIAAELPAARVMRLDAADAKLLAFEILRDQGANDRAEKALEQAMEMVLSNGRSTPESKVRAERLLARVLDGYGDRGRARQAIDRAIDIAGNHLQMLAPTVLSAVGRALVYKNLPAARAALQTGIKANLDDDHLVYGALWVMLLEKEMSESPDGKVERVLQDMMHNDSWIGELARWARGMSNDDHLRAKAKNYSEKIEAEFYITMRKRVSGQASATDKLRSIARNPLVDLMEVQIARDILAPKLRAKVPKRFKLPN
jgi:tetratricopeptide (TPR) repeat protein